MADGAQQCTADWLRSTKEGLKPDFNALDIWGAQTMMNWPTAFVIAVAICAGAFLYNKPSDAAFGGSDRYLVAVDRYWIRSTAKSSGAAASPATSSPPTSIATHGKPTDDQGRHL